MSRYPNIHSKIPLYHCHTLCKICGKPDSDCRIELRFNCFRGSNERYYVHFNCTIGLDPDQLMTALGCVLEVPIHDERYREWRKELYATGYGSVARINMDVRKGKLVPVAE